MRVFGARLSKTRGALPTPLTWRFPTPFPVLSRLLSRLLRHQIYELQCSTMPVISDGKVQFELGLKTDPILYRYSYPWLFRLMAQEGVRHAQLGTFFELYSLPDAWFSDLRRCAADHGIHITSVFTAHRELGGFFRDDGPGWTDVARRNFQRLVDVAALLGAESIGSNPGAVVRDRMGTKPAGLACYLKHFKELMGHAGTARASMAHHRADELPR